MAYSCFRYVMSFRCLNFFCNTVVTLSIFSSFGLIASRKIGPGSSVGIATDYGLDGPGIESAASVV
jgi:hypothetical protein